MIADLLPLAVGIAASPFPVIPVILLLLTPRATANAGAFLGGWVAGILAGTGAFVLLETFIEKFDEPPTWMSWVRVVLGAALVVLGVRQWLSRHEERPTPAWMQSLESATPRSAARLSVLLSLANPKILLFSAAAGMTIGATETTGTESVVAVVVFALAASVTVALPVLAHVVLGDRATAPLRRADDWLTENNTTIMAVVLLVIGALVLGKGVSGL
ncbi:MAG TPA: GAP family protein [Ornithinibacter sp.]|nr:GAP family protein [Ornithinibacter sp.]